jgi:hypothetical protein
MLRIFKRKYSLNLSDYEPHSTIKIISGTKKEVKKVKTIKKKVDNEIKVENERNPVGVQMIPEKLYRQIFGTSRKPSFNAELVEK